MAWVVIMYILTILIPIHGALWYARHRATIRMRKLVYQYWKLRKR